MRRYIFCVWSMHHTLPADFTPENAHWSAEYPADSFQHAYERGAYEAFHAEYSADDTITRLFVKNVLAGTWECLLDTIVPTDGSFVEAVIVDRLCEGCDGPD